MKHSLRSTFTAILAALALACAGFAAGGRADADGPGRAVLRQGHGERTAVHGRETPALTLLRGATQLIDGPPRRTGALPRIAPGADPSQDAAFAARTADLQAADARVRRTLILALARRLAAARDGTLSSRSTGVPPPLPA